MQINNKHYRTVWMENGVVKLINQILLPHKFEISACKNYKETAQAIKTMVVRGAGAIGATAGYGMAQAFLAGEDVNEAAEVIKSTRPTAQNLFYAVDKVLKAKDKEEAVRIANEIADEDASACEKIGEHGIKIIEEISKKKNNGQVNILTHCNAGWLAFVDYGSAIAPIYAAFDKGIKVHVWVDETRPRNQGARLTAWELGQHGVPYTVIADNVGGHLMQHGMVDLVIVGTDRTTYTGDVANKIGTYLKALAAKDNNIPFYVALPSSTFDWHIRDGVKEIQIEQRGDEEVKFARGFYNNKITEVLLTPEDAKTANYSFDVTPARLITGLITERGICQANEESILGLFPEHKK